MDKILEFSDQGKTRIEFELKSLPQLSDKSANGVIDFSWPSENELKNILIDEPIKMERIDIWSFKSDEEGKKNYTGMSGVQITLSDGTKSPLFLGIGNKQEIQETFEISNEVRKVFLKDDIPTLGLRFMDNRKKKICEWVSDKNDKV